VSPGRERAIVIENAGEPKGNQKQAREAVAVYEDLLPDMRQWRVEGLSLRAIAGRLNEAGHATQTGSPWNQVQVMRALDRGQDHDTK
jgi:hypothetical protein